MELTQDPLNRAVSPGEIVEDFHECLFSFIPDSEPRGQNSETGGEYNTCWTLSHSLGCR